MARSCPSPPVDCTRSEVVVLEGLSWSTFEAILAETGDARHSRLSYDRGRMEIVSPSWIHERAKLILDKLITLLCLERGPELCSAGSVTLRSASAEQAVEADQTYYVGENALGARGRRALDLASDPPPDLAIEIDVSRDSAWKLGVYEALGVREVWLISPETLAVTVRCLEDGAYAVREASAVLPEMPVGELGDYLQRATDGLENAALREFVERVRGAD